MKSIIIENKRIVKVVQSDVPERKKGEVLLKLLYGGICGSDLNSYRGSFAYVSYPVIPGHEFSAEIVDVDLDNDYGLKNGMLVTANPYFNCGECYSCIRGLVNCCSSNQTMGVQRNGAFSEYITMPEDRIYKSSGLNAKKLALIEPFAISWHAVKRAGDIKGARVLIVGSGTIGVFASIAAKLRGADVWMTDISQSKLEHAANLGLNGYFVNSSAEKFDKNVSSITYGDGFDVTIEAVGLPSTFQNCIDGAAFGGKVVLIGVGKTNLDFNFTAIQKKELNVYGSRNAIKDDFTELTTLLSQKPEILPDNIITGIYGFEDAPKAFEELDRNASVMLKVMLDFTKGF